MRLPPRNLLTCALLLDQISSSRLWRLLNQHVGGCLKKALPGSRRRTIISRTSPRRKHRRRRRRSIIAIPLARSLLLLLFIFRLHWLKYCVQSNIQQLYWSVQFPSEGGGLIFSFYPESVMIFWLDVCHVDKRVADMENMNNPWSKDVYPAAWSWDTIIQLHSFCQSCTACFFVFFVFFKVYSRHSWRIHHFSVIILRLPPLSTWRSRGSINQIS